MVIKSLFIISINDTKIFMEKHWCAAVKRNVMDDFLIKLKGLADPNDMPITMAGPNDHYFVHIYVENIIFCAVLQEETSPLMVTEFLHRVKDIFIDYFGVCTVESIKENFVVVYELLDEVLDAGFPLATEPNILKELIKPSSIIRSITNTVTGKSNVSENLPSGQLSNVPWRRAGVKYNNNEAFFDIKEDMNLLLDRQGSTLISSVNGRIDSSIKLSGMPDLSLSWMNAKIFNDAHFHPCIRLKRWNVEKLLSFIPPDGQFELMKYQAIMNNANSLPFSIRANSSVTNGRLDLTISPKRLFSAKPVEHLLIISQLPSNVNNLNLTANVGSYSFNSIDKVLKWDIGKLIQGKTAPPNLRGSIITNSKHDFHLVFQVYFKINQYAASNIKVNQMNVFGEGYKAFKGVKYITSGGCVEVRT
jgi:AP-3 complex subunit mu